MVQIKNMAIPITCSIQEASSLFNLPIPQFHQKYIATQRLKLDRLHQLSMHFVLKIYDAEQLGPWFRYKPFD